MTLDAVVSCSLFKGLTTDATRSYLIVAARVRVILPIPLELHGKLHFLSTTNKHIQHVSSTQQRNPLTYSMLYNRPAQSHS